MKPLVTPCWPRLTHKAHILEFSGAESYRFRERMQREAHRASTDWADG